MDQATDDEATDPAQHKNWNVFVRDDRVRQADQQPEQQADKPSWPARQLNASDHKSDGETARQNERPLLESYSGFDAEHQSVRDAIKPVGLDHVLKIGPKIEIRRDLNLMIELDVGFVRL